MVTLVMRPCSDGAGQGVAAGGVFAGGQCCCAGVSDAGERGGVHDADRGLIAKIGKSLSKGDVPGRMALS